jgi:hypothetical protein
MGTMIILVNQLTDGVSMIEIYILQMQVIRKITMLRIEHHLSYFLRWI